MRAINITKYGRFPRLIQLPVPSPDPNSVVVRMKFAPVNPSDINFFQGRYGLRKEVTPIVGFEGSGVIQDATDKSLIGRKVSVLSNMENGTHSTHIKSNLSELIFWSDDADLQLISMAWINPFSCIGLLEEVRRSQAKNLLLSAAGSQLCRTIIKGARIQLPEVKIYGMTRSDIKSQELIKLGATKIYPILEGNCEQVQEIRGKTAFLDCIGGTFAGRVFNDLPPKSIMKNYGRLSGQPLGEINLSELYFKDKTISGFWFTKWCEKTSEEEMKNHKAFLVQNFEQIFAQKVRQTIPLNDFMDGYRLAIKDQSSGKILLDLD